MRVIDERQAAKAKTQRQHAAGNEIQAVQKPAYRYIIRDHQPFCQLHFFYLILISVNFIESPDQHRSAPGTKAHKVNG